GGEEGESDEEGAEERQGGSGQADLQPGALEGHGEGLEVRGRGGRGRPRRGGGLASDRGSPAALVDGRRSGPDRLLRGLGLRGRRRALSHGGGGQAQEVPDALAKVRLAGFQGAGREQDTWDELSRGELQLYHKHYMRGLKVAGR